MMMNERVEFKRKGKNRAQRQQVGLSNRQYGDAVVVEGKQQERELGSSLTPTVGLADMMYLESRTKVVVRHLPPSLSEVAFVERIGSRFAGSYNWIGFHPGKASQKGYICSRAYIDLKRLQDVLEFYEAFDGHIFLNEKGSQYKASVEYAPYQRVPKLCSKKDVREGTVSKDPEYVEFLEQLAKPVEYLPSAEVQLERREAERTASLAAIGVKSTVIATPLMEFVRQKRASKAMPQRSLSTSGKLSARGGSLASTTSGTALSKRRVDRSRASTIYLPTHVMTKLKEKSIYVPQRDDNEHRDQELVLEKTTKENLEVKEKKFGWEASSPKLCTSNYHAVAVHDLDGCGLKDTQDVGLDLSVLPSPGCEVEQHGFHGKVPSNMDEATRDTGKESGHDLTEGKQLLVEEDKEITANVTSLQGKMVGGSALAGSGSVTPRHHNSTLTKSAAGAAFQRVVTSPESGITAATGFKQSQRWEADGRILRIASPLIPLQQSSLQASALLDNCDGKDMIISRSQNTKVSAKVATTYRGDTGTQQKDLPARISMDEKSITMAISDSLTYGSSTGRQDGRRVRNKDRPDRPVWMVRHRAEFSPTAELSSQVSLGISSISDELASTESSMKPERVGSQNKHGGKVVTVSGLHAIDRVGDYEAGSLQQVGLNVPVTCKGQGLCATSAAGTIQCNDSVSFVVRGSHRAEKLSSEVDIENGQILLNINSENKLQGSSISIDFGNDNGDSSRQLPHTTEKQRWKLEPSIYWNDLGGNQRQIRRDRNFQHVSRDSEGSLGGLAEGSKLSKRTGVAPAYGSHEKQVWVAKSGFGSGS